MCFHLPFLSLICTTLNVDIAISILQMGKLKPRRVSFNGEIKYPGRTFHPAQLNQIPHCSKNPKSSAPGLGSRHPLRLGCLPTSQSLGLSIHAPGVSQIPASPKAFLSVPHSLCLELLWLLVNISFTAPLPFCPVISTFVLRLTYHCTSLRAGTISCTDWALNKYWWNLIKSC